VSELIPEQTQDDTDADEPAAASDDQPDRHEEWLQSERPPHHGD
jgi:hypothetical protein